MMWYNDENDIDRCALAWRSRKGAFFMKKKHLVSGLAILGAGAAAAAAVVAVVVIKKKKKS